MTFADLERPLRRLPIDVRPQTGERVESYVRRLATANHLRPSYLHRYLMGPPRWQKAIIPARLAALTGRSEANLQRALIARGWPRPPKEPSGYLRRRHADKAALYEQIRAAAADPTMTGKQLIARFRVGHQTLAKALAAPTPPPWKPPYRKGTPDSFTRIDHLLDTEPHLSTMQLWERIVDDGVIMSMSTIRAHVAARTRSHDSDQPHPDAVH